LTFTTEGVILWYNKQQQNTHTQMALTLEQQRDRIQRLIKTANYEDYLDLHQELRSIQRDIVTQGILKLNPQTTNDELNTVVENIMETFK
jgi:NADPH-dependent curcumin reductase CurA